MDEKTYLSSRVDDQIDWLSGKAATNQKKYKYFRTISLVASVMVPLLSGYSEKFGISVTIVVGALGALVAVCQGLIALNSYHENWMGYRSTAEALKREKILYATHSAPYTAQNRFNLFVENTEKILAGENQKWLKTRAEADKSLK